MDRFYLELYGLPGRLCYLPLDYFGRMPGSVVAVGADGMPIHLAVRDGEVQIHADFQLAIRPQVSNVVGVSSAEEASPAWAIQPEQILEPITDDGRAELVELRDKLVDIHLLTVEALRVNSRQRPEFLRRIAGLAEDG